MADAGKVQDRKHSAWQPQGIDVANAAIQLLPVLGLLALQFFQAGLQTTVASSIAVSDSAGWLSCSSSALAGHVDPQIDWCMRRPMAIGTLMPVLALAPQSTASALVVQALIIAFASWAFLFVIRQCLVESTPVLLVVSAVLVVPAVMYGSNFGPEAMCLALSLLSATCLLVFLYSRRAFFGILSGVLAVVALQSRPGNPLLTLTICVGVVVLLWAWHRRPWAVLTGFLVLVVWLMPNRLLAMVGFGNAGHSGNFWATIYSLATPGADHWDAAYSRFAAESAQWGTESAAFGELLRRAALEEVLANPGSAAQQMATNVLYLMRHGLFTLAVGLPTGPTVPRPSDLTSTIMSLIGMPFWLASLALLILLPWATVKVWRQRRSWPRGGSQTHLVILLVLGWATVVGAVAIFALTGHDESTRHLIQNVPYLVLALITTVAILFPRVLKPRSQRLATKATHRSSIYALGAIGVVWILLLGTAVAEGHRSTATLTMATTCGSPDPEQRDFQLIGVANVSSQSNVVSPAGWRIGPASASSLFGLIDTWVGDALAKVPPGQVLALRDSYTGQVIASYLTEEVATMPDDTLLCLDGNSAVPGIKELAIAQVRPEL